MQSQITVKRFKFFHFNVRQPALNHKICLANRTFSSKGYDRLQNCELSICGAIFLRILF